MAGSPLPRLAATAVIVVGAAVSMWLNLPGHLSYDSVVQLAEARTGVYAGIHPPVMSWLLGIFDTLTPGAALFVVFDTGLIYGSLLSLVLLGRRTSWLTPLLAAASVALPQLLIYPAIVWKDVLFAGAATAGFACLAYAAAWWARPVWRYGYVGAALCLLTLAALARQNGAIVLPFAALALGWIVARLEGPGATRRAWAHGLVFLAAGALIAVGAAAALSTRSPGKPPLSPQWESLETWDIAGAISLEPAVDLPVLRARAPDMDTLLRTDGVDDYSPSDWGDLAPVADRITARRNGPALLAAQWRALILSRPLLYLRVRASAFEWVFLTPNSDDCLMVYTGVDGPAPQMRQAGLVHRETRMDDSLGDYATAFASTPALSHAAYGALGLVLLVGLLIRRRPADIAIAAMLASALTFAASFAVISIACDYRYLYDLDLAVIAAALYGVATWKRIAAPLAPQASSGGR